jgi:hypothetical protein
MSETTQSFNRLRLKTVIAATQVKAPHFSPIRATFSDCPSPPSPSPLPFGGAEHVEIRTMRYVPSYPPDFFDSESSSSFSPTPFDPGWDHSIPTMRCVSDPSRPVLSVKTILLPCKEGDDEISPVSASTCESEELVTPPPAADLLNTFWTSSQKVASVEPQAGSDVTSSISSSSPSPSRKPVFVYDPIKRAISNSYWGSYESESVVHHRPVLVPRASRVITANVPIACPRPRRASVIDQPAFLVSSAVKAHYQWSTLATQVDFPPELLYYQYDIHGSHGSRSSCRLTSCPDCKNIQEQADNYDELLHAARLSLEVASSKLFDAVRACLDDILDGGMVVTIACRIFLAWGLLWNEVPRGEFVDEVLYQFVEAMDQSKHELTSIVSSLNVLRLYFHSRESSRVCGRKR